MVSALPYLGVGLSYRWELNAQLLKDPGAVDWLEITPEHFLPFTSDAQSRLTLLQRRVPTVGHSLELSVGADGEDEPEYRAGLLQVLKTGACRWHGDHLCFMRVGQTPIRALTPLPFHDEAVSTAVRNIKRLQGELPVPFIVENITYYFHNPLTAMAETEFLRQVVLGADCGLLLDLHNLLANAINHHYDPYRFIDQLPLERVVQIHLAGGVFVDGLHLDSHNRCCPPEVFSLLQYVAPRCPVRGVNFEMDGEFPPFARLREELGHAREILQRCGAPKA